MKRLVLITAALALSTAAFAQQQPPQPPSPAAETEQLKQIAQGGLELLKRTPATGPIEAQVLLNLNLMLGAVVDGKLVVQRPVPPSPMIVPGLQGGPPLPPGEGK